MDKRVTGTNESKDTEIDGDTQGLTPERSYLPTPQLRHDMTQGQFLSGV